MRLIDGRKIAAKIETQLQKSKRKGGLAAILVGNNLESRLYLQLKERAARRVGIYFEKISYPPAISQETIIKKIRELNRQKNITGIIVQLPLPKKFNTNKIITALDPKKDVDGYHPANIAAYEKDWCPKMPPAVFTAVQEILKSAGIKTRGKNIVFVSKKNSIFPLPFEHCFGRDAKTFIKASPAIAAKYLSQADIIFTAVGKKHYLKSRMVKAGTVVIDIGIARQGRHVYGDADPVSLAQKSGWLTPVPGGVGPVTVACLLKNTLK